MRMLLSLLVLVFLSAEAQAQAKDAELFPERYGIKVDKDVYSQEEPKITLQSIIAAIERKRFDYLAAQLIDPEFIDRRVQAQGGNFESVVKDISFKLNEDPNALRLLKKFQLNAKYRSEGDVVIAEVADEKDRIISFKRYGERWFMENTARRKEMPEPTPPPPAEKKE